jgi:hypothetical protein
MRNIDDLLLTLCICCLPLLLPAALGVGVYIGWYLPRAQLKRLAEQMGWKLDTRYPFPYHGYYGTHQGRIAEMCVGAQHRGHVHPDRSRWRAAIQLTVELQMKEPRRLDAHAYHHGPKDSFESVFRQWRSEPISKAARAAMLGFARKRTDLSLDSFPVAGNSPTPPPVTKMELHHTMPGISGVTPTEVRAALDDLIEVARVMETMG